MSRLRIGVNALYLLPGQVGGTEVYLRNLIRALAQIDTTNEYFLFTNRETGASLCPQAANFFLEQQKLSASNRPARLLWEQFVLPREARRLGLDVLFNPGFTAPLRSPCPNVTVFHDLQHKRHPEHFRWWDLPFWRFFLHVAAFTSKRIIAVSQSTKDDLVSYYDLPPGLIDVVPHGVNQCYFKISRWPEESKPYLLCVSTLHPHKNLERLVRVFATFREATPNYWLVLAGLKGFQAKKIQELVHELGQQPHIEITGWVSDSRLHDLYRRAAAFIYPSTFEGFGMPVLEAMAAGIPLACSDIEPLRSLVDGTAALFSPDDDSAMLEAMRRITSPSPSLGEQVARARARAATFTWTACAERTLASLTAAAATQEIIGFNTRPATSVSRKSRP